SRHDLHPRKAAIRTLARRYDIRSDDLIESPRRRRDYCRAVRIHLPDFERVLGDAVAAETEGAVDADEAGPVAQGRHREAAADRPARGDPLGQEDGVVAEAGQPERVAVVAGAVPGPERAEIGVGGRRVPGAAPPDGAA